MRHHQVQGLALTDKMDPLGLSPAVIRTRRCTLHCDAEMFNSLLMWTVIECKCLVTKKTQKEVGIGQYLKKWIPSSQGELVY